ncbi:MAG: cytochrome c [Planctomycetota bacterium]
MSIDLPSVSLRAVAAVAAAAGLTAGLAGCRGERTDKPPRQFFPDMDDSPRFEAQEATEFFVDGRTQRPVVPGAVGFGRTPVNVEDPAVAETGWAQHYATERARLIKDDEAVYLGIGDPDAGADTADAWLETIPVSVDRDLIDLGRKNFDIYCATCHGYEGDGQGTVGVRWSAPVPSFYDPKYADPEQFSGRDGYIYHVARNGLVDPNGVLRMPGYKHAINEREAWGVVAYIRTLQAARGVPIDSDIIPDAERQRLSQSAAPRGAGQNQQTVAEGGDQ